MSVTLRKGLAALLLGVVALWLAPESKAAADGRHIWAYGNPATGYFDYNGGNSWTQHHTNGQTFSLKEVERTPNYITLSETRGRFTFRLFNDHAEIKEGRGWLRWVSGGWR